jgi:hypothetical protein
MLLRAWEGQMHKFIQAIGGVIASLGLFVAGYGVNRTSGFGGAAVPFVIVGLSMMLSGAILYCFGSIVEHLKAIRRSTERQLEIFDRLGKNRTE